MKNKIFILSVFVHLAISFKSNSQNWQWAKQVGSNILQSYDSGVVITDGNNSYLIGRYSNAIYLQTDTLYSYGSNDLFIIKYDPSGNELWAMGFGGNGTSIDDLESVNAVFDSSTGSIYLSGRFSGMMILGNDTLNSAPNILALYIAKVDLNGNFLWAKSIKSIDFNQFGQTPDAEVFCSPNGIVYLTGGLKDTVVYSGYTLLPGGFLLKFDSNGNCLFGRNLFSNLVNRVRVKFIANDLILSGSFQDASFTLDTATIVGKGNFDFFISRTNSNGNIVWIKTFGNAGFDALGSVDVDANTDEIYFCGGFEDSLTINSNTFYNNGKELLFGKLDENGNTVWIKQCNAVNNVGGANYLKLDSDGNFYAVGYFSGNVTFGTYAVSTINTYDMFLARYNSSGDCLGVRNFGTATGGRVAIDNSGNPICSGGFLNTITIGSNTFTSNGYFDIYLAKSDVLTGLGEGGRVKNNQLLIYANPNQGKCTINVPDDFLNERNLTLSILDNTGKLIQQKSLYMNDGKIKLNLEQEAKGIYNVVLTNNVKSYYGKIVFE